MDNEMIERYANAVYDKFNENLIPSLEPHWKDLPEDFKFRMKEAVKAGIKAMREPNDKIIEAAFGKSDLTPHPFKTAWYNMIDAIIGDR